jgi:diguanylate cyclase (GGDEF)-like protein
MPAAKAGEKSTESLLRWVDGPVPRGEEVVVRLDEAALSTGRPVHAELLRILTHLHYSNEAARRVWAGYQVHRATLRRRLGRDVGGRVALFDYLVNVERRLDNPTIIERSHFEKTARSAITDHLTGLFNRGHFESCLRKEVNRCRRYGQSVSMLMVDLDDFKNVNDRHGHAAGDAALREVGRLLVQRVRDIDVAARYGGEEFAVILPETRRTSAHVVAERIRGEVERHFKRKNLMGGEARLTLSGGIASFPEDAASPEQLVERADQALYRAKRAGKNRISIYYTEKRRAPRVSLAGMEVRVAVRRGEDAEGPACRALNVSERGILLECSRPLTLGQTLELRLELPGTEMSLHGDVVRLEERQTPRGRKVYDAGVRFRFGRKSLPHGLSRFLRESAGTASQAARA